MNKLFTYCNNDSINNIDPTGYIRVKYQTIKKVVNNLLKAKNALSYTRTWGMLGRTLLMYWPLFSAWFNALPGVGQFLFIASLVTGAFIAYVIAKAYIYKKDIYFGVKISGPWYKLKFNPYFYYA